MNHTLTAILFALFAIVCLFIYFQVNKISPGESSLIIAIPEEWQTCNIDADCVDARPGCCACAADGSSAGINIKYFIAWEKRLSQLCKNVNCSSVSCRHGRITCENKKCTFKSL